MSGSKMIGSSILLFPDTGPKFLRALRISALYSEHVRVLTLLEKDFNETFLNALEDGLESYGQTGVMGTVLVQRFLEYTRFVTNNFDDLKTLQVERILTPLVGGNTLSEVWRFRDSAASMIADVAKQNDPNDKSEVEWPGWLHEAFLRCPPSFFDLHMMMAYVLGQKKKEITTEDYGERACESIMFYYLLMIALMAEEIGVGTSTWSSQFQDALWAVRAFFQSSEQDRMQRRQWTANRLGQVVIENHVPLIDDLPINEILSLRLKRRVEIESFRLALGELATEIDPVQPPADVELQIHDLVAKRVNPALNNLRAAIASSRLDILQKMGRSTTALATATVPAVLAFAAGAPINVSAGLAALGAMAGSLLDGFVEERKLVNASQWSILLRLREKAG